MCDLKPFPASGECMICKERAKKHHAYQNDAWLEQADEILWEIVDSPHLEEKLEYTDHANKRCLERAINRKKLISLLREAGTIEYFPYKKEEMEFLVQVREAGNGYIRILNIALAIPKDYEKCFGMKIITVYDPRTEAYRWDRHFKKRICWCEK